MHNSGYSISEGKKKKTTVTVESSETENTVVGLMNTD